MKFYEFGASNLPVMLLLPGTCYNWRANFGEVLPLLESDFHVVCVSYDGFDETENTVFPDILNETEKIEAYIKDKHRGHICAAYGCSLGGSFVGILLQRGVIHIDHAILGSSDLDQETGLTAKLKSLIVAGLLTKILHTGKLPGWMRRRMRKKPPELRAYTEKFLRLFCGDAALALVKRQSVYNQFYSDLVTPVEDEISVSGTAVHCFYAEKMGAKYLARYEKHFKAPDIRRFDLQHEELLLCLPQRWAAEVRACCGI
ncbi:alpha/beta hydrolase [Oscillospiraceae bacterium HV4-5-C5C]|nr:alpha/beta hydrolase [Oscillospiraceae bacterium HV4-5-C5C]